MSEVKTDLELIAEFQAGNQQSFEEIVERYSTKVFGMASRLTKNQQDAEEVLQDVFVTVYRKIKGFEGKSSFSSWLYRVTVNASFMRLRRKRIDQNAFSLEDAMPQVEASLARICQPAKEGEATTYVAELNEALEEAIAKLPDEYRPVFVLRDVDGLSTREVGKILNLSIPAVKSRLHRSRLMLQKKLRKVYRESGAQSDKQVGNL